MPKRAQQVSDSSSDSEDERLPQISEALYSSLQLRAALQRPADYAVAAAELCAIVRHLFSTGRCSKPAQATVIQDIALAIECCDMRLQSRSALAALMEAAERHLPQAKRKELLRQYKRSSVQLRRHERRAGTGGAVQGEDGDDEAAEPATFDQLPSDVMAHVLRYLDPITLARAACVSREWRQAAYADELWQPHCAELLSSIRAASLGSKRGKAAAAAGGQHNTGNAPVAPPQSSNDNQGQAASWRHQFTAAALQHPAKLLHWCTNRVAEGRRLAWLPNGTRAPPGCCHVSTAVVLTYLSSGGKRLFLKGANGSCSGSDEEDEGHGGSALHALSGRLKFWQL